MRRRSSTRCQSSTIQKRLVVCGGTIRHSILIGRERWKWSPIAIGLSRISRQSDESSATVRPTNTGRNGQGASPVRNGALSNLPEYHGRRNPPYARNDRRQNPTAGLGSADRNRRLRLDGP